MATANAAVDLYATSSGAAWIQENKDNFLCGKVPEFKVPDLNTDIASVQYRLPALDTFMLSGEGLADFVPGQERGKNREVRDFPVDIKCGHKALPSPYGRAIPGSGAHRMRALDKDIVPGCYSVIHQGIDLETVALLKNSNYFDQTAWAENLDTTTSVDPLRVLKMKLLPYRKYQGTRWNLEMFVDLRVLSALSAFVQISGGGKGSGENEIQTAEQTRQRIAEALEIDAVHISKAGSNTANEGQTVALTDIAGGLCAFVLVDKVKSYTITPDSPNQPGPDGGIAIAYGRLPYIVSDRDDFKEWERFDARAQFKVYCPRGTTNLQAGLKFGFNMTGGLS